MEICTLKKKNKTQHLSQSWYKDDRLRDIMPGWAPEPVPARTRGQWNQGGESGWGSSSNYETFGSHKLFLLLPLPRACHSVIPQNHLPGLCWIPALASLGFPSRAPAGVLCRRATAVSGNGQDWPSPVGWTPTWIVPVLGATGAHPVREVPEGRLSSPRSKWTWDLEGKARGATKAGTVHGTTGYS